MVSQQSTSANLTFYKFMPFCRNYHISLTAFITALFFLLVISSCSRFEWNVDFDHDIIPEIRTFFFLCSLVFILFFLCFKNLYLAFFSVNVNIALIVGMYLKNWHWWNQRLNLSTQKAFLSQWISTKKQSIRAYFISRALGKKEIHQKRNPPMIFCNVSFLWYLCHCPLHFSIWFFQDFSRFCHE